ncbi:hypothetical protein MPTK1_2g05760 [Marchantia polymorpha subsp. ruderalis]|uniref:Transmembrane protein n=1 Tax=Marchantia polymorpha TaxID=3197 RepID=A0A2R6XDG6_MARPO|nr:hypothetical protein MARPO_0021s0032 [Marchantia polymorpha]BBN01224.1 hypothetical protein Mp_2g05760 [Marchantia polymorpha subsp. ruderalis]|eukprot:PTQ44150.1 hypothetical protein MARPO_0021s0032 [Marchantia polymorpha]
MAPWVWTKLRHPFTPDDVLASRKIVSSLSLPGFTSHFVLALTDPRNPSSVVYLLSVEKLSERSVADIRDLVAAVRPSSVVAFVDDKYIADIGDEENSLDGGREESLHVPTTVFDVLKQTFLESSKASVYESRAGLRLLISVFGTTFYGNVIAAKKAAQEAGANFEYLRFPATAVDSFLKEDSEDSGPTSEAGADPSSDSAVSSALDRVLNALSEFLGDCNSENLTSASQRVVTRSLRASYPQELRAVAPSYASTLSRTQPALALASVADRDQDSAPSVKKSSEDDEVEADCPPFAVPFFPLFVDLHNLFNETPFVNQALSYSRNLLKSVDNGEDVNHEDLAGSRAFRVAVESVRLSWNSLTQRSRGTSESKDFALLPYEEKCQALLATALKHQGEKCKSVVAIVDASNVPGIWKHWNTPVPAEVAAYAEYCFVPMGSGDSEEDIGLFKSMVMEKPETKAAVVVSAGAAAAVGLVSLPSISTIAKVLTFKVPSVLKIVFMQVKRSAIISLTKAITPASNVVLPAFKAVGSGNMAFVPSSTVKAVALKSAATAEKARMAAHSMVAAAERASLQAIRTAFYSLMKNRQAKNVGPRPWLMLAGTLTTAAGVWCYGEGLEHAISIAPSAPAVARLGRGLEKLEQASQAVAEVEGRSNWDRVYRLLYSKKS